MNRYVAIVVLVALIGACATSPTGRSQLLLMSAVEMNQMGATAFADMKDETSIETQGVTNRYVSCVANAITAELDAKDQQAWEVVVFKDDSANAFALPGGKIGVHTGLLKVAVTQDQLASVIGHEVGHVLAQHGNERMSLQFASQSGQQLIGVLLEGTEQKPLLMAAMGMGAEYGVQLPFSRAHESEADLIGLQLMAKAGFEPQASVELWQNMAKNSNGAPPEFLSTHPANQTRIGNLQDNMTDAMMVYQQARQQGKRPQCQ
ncbi:MAG: M48 family metallopeptidase [Spongiibacteraceae bacterium]